MSRAGGNVVTVDSFRTRNVAANRDTALRSPALVGRCSYGHSFPVRSMLQGKALHLAIAEVVANHLPTGTCRAWIIGSEATGRAGPGADLDVAIDGAVPLPLETLSRLRDDLDQLPTLRVFDLVDLRRTTGGFAREALREAIPLVTAAGRRAHAES